MRVEFLQSYLFLICLVVDSAVSAKPIALSCPHNYQTADEPPRALTMYHPGRDQLIEQNMPLVIYVAKKYVGKGMELDDLIQEGNVGLTRAVDAWDGERPLRKIAGSYIRNQIRKALTEKSRLIRLPNHLVAARSKYRRAKEELEGKGFTEITTEMIAARAGISASEAKLVEHSFSQARVGMSEGKLAPEKAPAGGLDNEASNEERAAAGQLLRGYLDRLDEEEKKVIALNFGLNGETAQSIWDIGRLMGKSHEQVRIILKRGLSHIRERMERGGLEEVEQLFDAELAQAHAMTPSPSSTGDYTASWIKEFLSGHPERSAQQLSALLDDFRGEPGETLRLNAQGKTAERIAGQFGKSVDIVRKELAKSKDMLSKRLDALRPGEMPKSLDRFLAKTFLKDRRGVSITDVRKFLEKLYGPEGRAVQWVGSGRTMEELAKKEGKTVAQVQADLEAGYRRISDYVDEKAAELRPYDGAIWIRDNFLNLYPSADLQTVRDIIAKTRGKEGVALRMLLAGDKPHEIAQAVGYGIDKLPALIRGAKRGVKEKLEKLEEDSDSNFPLGASRP